jgi:hypothetical protein
MSFSNSITVIILLFSITVISACSSGEKETKELGNIMVSAEFLHSANVALEQDIVHDFFSPPVAGRIYLYPNLTAYEILSQESTKYQSLTTVFDFFPKIPAYSGGSMYELAAIYSFLNVSRDMLYTTEHIDTEIARLDSLFTNNPELTSVKEYSEKVSKIMDDWIKMDKYLETRNMGEYKLLETKDSWVPTPPDYLNALEPHWEKIRPMTLDSASQFAPPPPTEFDMKNGSQYHNELLEVYDAVMNKTDSTEAMAKFWDCNPIVSRHEGHITYSEKKLTPGGHWVNICRMVAKKENFDLMETSYSYTSLSIGIFDAFISCWQAKYSTNYIRPVTVIQNEIDPSWMPILITPNFPEYTSGHSVVSRSASTVLTFCFGDNYSFTDSTEVPYGMPPRSFTSFHGASEEAALSRLYGGIHYAPSIYDGLKQGSNVGQNVVSKIKKLRK